MKLKGKLLSKDFGSKNKSLTFNKQIKYGGNFWMITEKEAKSLMTKAHLGQIDRLGQPYYLHPFRVGSAGYAFGERVVGYLHDVVEDTDIDLLS